MGVGIWPGVKNRPRLHTAAIGHEEIQPEYPAYIGLDVPGQLLRDKVGLEGADGVHQTESAHPGAGKSEERDPDRVLSQALLYSADLQGGGTLLPGSVSLHRCLGDTGVSWWRLGRE